MSCQGCHEGGGCNGFRSFSFIGKRIQFRVCANVALHCQFSEARPDVFAESRGGLSESAAGCNESFFGHSLIRDRSALALVKVPGDKLRESSEPVVFRFAECLREASLVPINRGQCCDLADNGEKKISSAKTGHAGAL
jgi:hypothetical protein